MKLIGSDTSPYVRKVRIVLAEKKIDCQYLRENVWAEDSTIRDVNPLAKVPALVLEDGQCIVDSAVIVEYLDNLTPVHRLIPPPGRARAEVRTLEALADGLLDAAILIRLENQRADAQRSPAWIARQMDKIECVLRALSEGLGERPWFCEGKYSLADLAVGCALGYLDFRFPQLDWRGPCPNLARLQGALMQRRSFQDTVPPVTA